jgi:hypothetical protein
LSKSYRGKQSKLHISLIKQEKGLPWPIICTLNLGDVQSMVFLPGDEGPYGVTAEHLKLARHDVEIQRKK